MEALSLPIYSREGKKLDSLELDPKVFGGKPNPDVVYQVVTAYLANQRMGLAATKTRGEVSGGGRKPWRQKGTGRARAGSTRSPLWRHGGVIFGPHPRSFYYKLPQRLKKAALKSAVLAKLGEDNIVVVDNFNLESAKTKEAVKIFANLKVKPERPVASKVLLLLKEPSAELIKALRNIGFLDINRPADTHAYEWLAHKKIVVTREAFSQLLERLKA